MSYSIEWNPKALDSLRKLPREISQRMVKKVSELKENPYHYLDRLIDDPGFKLRVGDYRSIVDIEENKKLITVRLIDHRKRIYKNLNK